jgi:hypothetical protein
MKFVDAPLEDMFFLRFEDIFSMFHLKQLHHTIVLLVAFSLTAQFIGEKTTAVAIIDPFFMLEYTLSSPGNRVIVTNYVQDFLVANKEKEVILVPYFLE